MLSRIHVILRKDEGFTLVELLTVVSIIGSLAAIAVPNLVEQQTKGQDGTAKSNARNAVTAVESCYTDRDSYARCDTQAKIEASGIKVGLPFTDTVVKQEGAVSVIATPDTYTVTAYSESGSQFWFSKAADGTTSQSW